MIPSSINRVTVHSNTDGAEDHAERLLLYHTRWEALFKFRSKTLHATEVRSTGWLLATSTCVRSHPRKLPKRGKHWSRRNSPLECKLSFFNHLMYIKPQEKGFLHEATLTFNFVVRRSRKPLELRLLPPNIQQSQSLISLQHRFNSLESSLEILEMIVRGMSEQPVFCLIQMDRFHSVKTHLGYNKVWSKQFLLVFLLGTIRVWFLVQVTYWYMQSDFSRIFFMP